MSLSYIRGYYNVPAKRFGRIEFDGKPGVILGARGPYLRARVTGHSRIVSLHPTWRVTYLPAPDGSQCPAAPDVATRGSATP
jgi:hypothetical protein